MRRASGSSWPVIEQVRSLGIGLLLGLGMGMGLIEYDEQARARRKAARPELTPSFMRLKATTPGRSARTASRVKEIRLARGMSQVALAAAVGTGVNTVRKAERGYLAQFRVTTILRIANALDVGVADLFPVLAGRLDRL